MQKGDIIALGGATEHLTEKMGLIGPEVADPGALGIPMDQADILLTKKDVVGRTFESFRDTTIAGQLQVTKVERGGVQIPADLKTELQRMDLVSVVGLKSAVNEFGEMWGRIARTNASTDLLTLAAGMIIRLSDRHDRIPGLRRQCRRRVAVAAHRRSRADDLHRRLHRLHDPPFIVWAIGFHIFKINPAELMGGVAGARSHSGPCREAAVEIQSSVSWIGFPGGYAVSGILLTMFGYFAMLLAQ